MTSDQRDVAMILIGGVLAVAALIASISGASGSWVTSTGGFVLDILLVGALVAALVIVSYLLWAVVTVKLLLAPGVWVIERIEKAPHAPAILPPLAAFLAVALVRQSDELLADEPVLKWLLAILVAVITMAGAILAYLGFGSAVTLAGFVVLAIPTVVIGVFASRDWSSWWETYSNWSTTDQAYLVAGLATYLLTLITAVLVALYGWSSRRKNTHGEQSK